MKALRKSRLSAQAAPWGHGEQKPDAGNPHVRFDEGEGDGITAVPSLLYRLRIPHWDGALPLAE
jgi:hypothetical protein